MITPKRHIRCEDELWLPAMEKAERLGTTISAVVRLKLREFLDEPENDERPSPLDRPGASGSGEGL